MEEILSQASKVAKEAEVFTVSSEQTPVEFEANRLKHIQTKQSSNTALRVIHNGRIGYATTNRVGGNQNLVDMAMETAEFGMPAGFDFPSKTSYPRIEVYDPDVESVTLEEMVRLGEEMIAAATSHTPDIMCEAGITRSVTSVSINNSRGGQAEYRISVFSLGLMGHYHIQCR